MVCYPSTQVYQERREFLLVSENDKGEQIDGWVSVPEDAYNSYDVEDYYEKPDKE